MMKKQFAILLFSILFIATSCSSDDDNVTTEPTASATFKVTIENVFTPKTFKNNGTFDAIPPQGSQSFSFDAGKGAFLSLSTMFVKSNDLFLGFSDTGLALYDANGNATTGNVTSQLLLWDAGTEVNEEPGVGANQPMNQSGPNTGVDENGVIHLVNDGFTYPSTETIINISLAHNGGTMFTVTINNVSDTSTLPSPLAPGVWAIHGDQAKLFTNGVNASAGMEKLAEDGDNSMMDGFLTGNSGYLSPYAPGVFAIHNNETMPIFSNNASDNGNGLENLAEDGDPSVLGASLSSTNGVSESGVFNTPEGAGAPGPLLPNNSYTFTFTAEEGDYLNLALMLVESNDLFYAFNDEGISLFNNRNAISGDMTSQLSLWDAGTEVNEFPGAGNNQPIRGGAGTGTDENGNVVVVNDGFSYPSTTEAIKVTIEIQ